MNPQHITLKQVRAAAYKAYMNSQLQAQAMALGDEPTPTYEAENHEGRICYCAIGPSLNADTLKSIVRRGLMAAPVFSLVVAGLITYPDEDSVGIQEVQDAHDTWCTAPLTERELAEGDFLRLVRPEG